MFVSVNVPAIKLPAVYIILNYFVLCIHVCLSAMVKQFDLESYDSMSLAREHRNRSKINAFCE